MTADASRPTPLTEAQSDWFIQEVRKCAAMGMPLGCCDEWPECSHMLTWYARQREAFVCHDPEGDWITDMRDQAAE